ncbi:MAG: bifunctional 4-hydroxy-2-oxoglutarate aldolase/2-dehydro-3-deoxy-phosphogluconate aldolase [Firmicutes bacterium]|jgi:2-dehydro-3-deoxyphosphogluconate aldolase/(4S)-4-hydroxy-2-oxoglutarate aldolase|nr:bifunctional 4-hydroxy-2-oxoglutarate aldolase/2-dehydro-3-deoxy-phosphogluconate aldolase [Bacillota bacterium]
MKYKIEVFEKMMESRVVAVLRKFDTSKVVPLAQALVEGGITAIEITMDTENALQAIADVRKALGKDIAVGAGTVLDPETGRAAMLAGAQFLVAPTLNVDLIRLGNRYGRMVVPGCMTPTEIQQACEAGADVIKIFPAGVVTANFFRNVLGPLDHITLMATGGVSIDNVKEYRAKGVDVVGVGGNLIDKEAIAAGQFEKITAYAAKLVEEAK